MIKLLKTWLSTHKAAHRVSDILFLIVGNILVKKYSSVVSHSLEPIGISENLFLTIVVLAIILFFSIGFSRASKVRINETTIRIHMPKPLWYGFLTVITFFWFAILLFFLLFLLVYLYNEMRQFGNQNPNDIILYLGILSILAIPSIWFMLNYKKLENYKDIIGPTEEYKG